MIPIILAIASYDKQSNKFKARVNGTDNIVNFDPFVSCCIRMSDEDYELGKGSDLVGNCYCATIYTVYTDELVPHEGGLTLINN